MVGWHSGTGSGHSARCSSADSCHCCCHGDSMFTVATHLCVAFRRYLVNRKLKATRRNKPRQFIDFCNRNMFSETPSKAVNIVSKYLFESKTIRLKMALQYPQTPEDSCGNDNMKTRRVEDPSIGRDPGGSCLMASSCFSSSCLQQVHGHFLRSDNLRKNELF